MNNPTKQPPAFRKPDMPFGEFRTILLLDGWISEILQVTGDQQVFEFKKEARMIRVDTSNPNHLNYGYWDVIPMSTSNNISYHKRAEQVLRLAKIWT